jgi:diacylglycerol kinase family enzyme
VLAPGEDAGKLAREAAERGVEALGAAGGDGSLAPVAAQALAADLPFLPVPYGTRNHFARDAGFDLDDPEAALGELEERRVDVGEVNGRIFLNNVSLGLYAALVHDPARRTKNRLIALARMLQAGFGRTRTPLDLAFDVDGDREHHRALVVLVANNDYGSGRFSELTRRDRLDEGRLHAYVVEAAARRTLVALLWRAARGRVADAEGGAAYAARAFEVEAKRTRLHAAIDGEPAVLEAPLAFTCRPRALRLLAPRSRDTASTPGSR